MSPLVKTKRVHNVCDRLLRGGDDISKLLAGEKLAGYVLEIVGNLITP